MVTTLGSGNNQLDLDLPGGVGPDTIFAQAGADLIKTSTLGGSIIFGEGGNDTLLSVGANDSLFGGQDEDSLRSSIAGAWLSGDKGEDTIIANARATVLGKEGRDFLQGVDAGNVMLGDQDEDIILGGSQGDDSINGGQGNDSIGFFTALGGNNLGLQIGAGVGGNEGSNLLRGDKGDDLIAGINDKDSLYGGPDNDDLIGIGNNVLLQGDDGNDTLNLRNPVVPLPTTIGGSTQGLQGYERATLLGGAGDDYLYGPAAQDFRKGQSILDGGDGADTIAGYAARDTLMGGAGDDSLTTVASSGTFQLADGTTVPDLNQNGVPFSLPGYLGENLLDGGDGNDTLNPSFLSDTILGGAGNDSLTGIFRRGTGGDGNDTIDATQVGTGASQITLDGGLGNDTLLGNSNTGVINIFDGGAGNDFVKLAGTGDRLVGSFEGNDTLDGRSVNFGNSTTPVTISDTLGNNVLLFNSSGNSTVSVRLTTGGGNDILSGSNASKDVLIGGAGTDAIDGFGGDDTLDGGDANDSLTGGLGADTLIGGAGNDTFFYNSPLEGGGSEGVSSKSPGTLPVFSNGDIITSFVVNQDKLVFSRAAFGNDKLLTIGNRPSDRSFLQLDPNQGYDDSQATNGANPIFVYEASGGNVLFDSNGTNVGGIRIMATIGDAPAFLGPTDLLLI